MIPELQCGGRTVQIQAGRNLWYKPLSLLATIDSCSDSMKKRVYVEKLEQFELLTEPCPTVLAFMPSILRRKAEPKEKRSGT